MKLFEGGILDKITNDEYEKMFQSMPMHSVEEKASEGQEAKINGRQSSNTKTKISSEKELTALNLRMLQGAFYLVLIGHVLATITLLIEIQCKQAPKNFIKNLKRNIIATFYHIAFKIRELSSYFK